MKDDNKPVSCTSSCSRQTQRGIGARCPHVWCNTSCPIAPRLITRKSRDSCRRIPAASHWQAAGESLRTRIDRPSHPRTTHHALSTKQEARRPKNMRLFPPRETPCPTSPPCQCLCPREVSTVPCFALFPFPFHMSHLPIVAATSQPPSCTNRSARAAPFPSSIPALSPNPRLAIHLTRPDLTCN